MAYYVVREYSGHTAKKMLWKVLSCRFDNYLDARNWMDYCKSLEPKQNPGKFFIVNKVIDQGDPG